jgi:putative salt-induced outer membrane protein YdiY
MTLRRLLAVCLLLVLGAAARADQLVMQNGSILIGTMVNIDEDQVVFNTPFAGDITVTKQNIKTIVTEQGVNILMADGTVYRDKRIVAQEEDLVVFSEEARPVRFDVADISLINPDPWRLGDGYKWFGHINASLESERGNTDSDEYDGDFESIWRSLEDRYTLRGGVELDEANNDRNKYQWYLRGKYDIFSESDPDNYVGAQLVFQRDEFADLDLRTATGPYIGRQFFERRLLTLHAEIGIVYVDEQFDIAEDNDFWGSNWEARLNSELFAGLEFYVYQDGVYNFSNADELIANTTIGLRFPLLYGVEAAAEALYEYDGGAVEGVDDTDETYKVKLGYRW